MKLPDPPMFPRKVLVVFKFIANAAPLAMLTVPLAFPIALIYPLFPFVPTCNTPPKMFVGPV